MNGLISPDDVVRLIETVGTLSSRLGCTTHDAIDHIQRLASGVGTTRTPRTIPKFAERNRSIRSRRNEMMSTNMFRDPGWDMMLDLYVSHGEGRQASTSALCIGSGAPATTALRHMDRLEHAGLIVRTPDRREIDQRPAMIDLAPGVKDRLETVLAKLQDCY